MKSNNLYPIFVKLDVIQTLIVGGGNVGLEKVNFILRQSPEAKIKVISKEFHPEIILLAIKNPNLQITEREYGDDDLKGIKLLILATNNKKVNFEIYQKAKQFDILTNVVDNPPLCDFYTGAVLKKGVVKIAVSSNGVSPTLAKRLRDIIADIIPDKVDETAQLLSQIRAQTKGSLEDKITLLNKVTELLINDNNHIEQLNKENEFYDLNLN
jgi:siroheme synthase-like protein